MTQNSWGYRPALDGTRTIAVYLVVLFHAGMSTFAGGFIGVDLFFVLSGYLVTNVIVSEMENTGAIRLRRFYARRVRRLLPASVVVIVTIALLWVLVAPLTERLGLINDARSALLYYANWHFLIQDQDYFAAAGAESPFVHFWSLAIEEQFYVVYPLILIGLVRLRSRVSEPWRGLMVPGGLAALFAASLTLQILWSQINATHAYYGTDARLYQLLAGCLLAILGRQVSRSWGRAGNTLAGVAVIALILTSTRIVDVTPSTRGIIAMACSVGLIAGLERGGNGWVSAILSRPLPVYLGRISYGTYLWHWPIVLTLGRIFDVAPWMLGIMTILVATGMAALSAQVLEMPIRNAARLDPWPRTVVAVGLTCSALVALTIPRILESEAKPAIAASRTAQIEIGSTSSGPGVTEDQLVEDLEAALAAGPPAGRDGSADFQTLTEIVGTARRPVSTDIDWASFSDDSFDAPLCDASTPENCTLVDGDGMHILLVGDSTARTFIPMLLELAKQKDLTISANVRQACGWTVGSYRTDQNDNEICKGARDGWYATAIPRLNPDLIILAQRSMTGPQWDERLRADDPDIDRLPLAERLAALSNSTLDALEQFGIPIVVTEPVAAPIGWNILDCMSGATVVRECAFRMDDSPEDVERALRERADRSSLIRSVDLDRVVCPLFPTCIPYVDDTVVWRDGIHVTTSYWTLHRESVWAAWQATTPTG